MEHETPEVIDTSAPATEETVTSPVTPEADPSPEAPTEVVDGPLSEEDFEASEAKEDVPEPEEEKPKKSRFQERIDKLTADKYAAEREARQLRERIERLEQRERPQVDPDDYDAVENERIRRAFEETEKTRYSEDANYAAQQAQQARQELFQAKLEAARERIPDLEDAIRSFAQLPVTADSAEIIADSPKAAEIAHYLGTNPDLTRQIASMSPANQGRAIAQIENRVSLPPKRVSQAPPPPPKLKPTSAPMAKDPSEMTAAEYVSWRKQQWAKE